MISKSGKKAVAPKAKGFPARLGGALVPLLPGARRAIAFETATKASEPRFPAIYGLTGLWRETMVFWSNPF